MVASYVSIILTEFNLLNFHETIDVQTSLFTKAYTSAHALLRLTTITYYLINFAHEQPH